MHHNRSQVTHPPAQSWTQVSVRPCEVEEADQRLVRHILNLINNSYKNTLIHLVDTDVLVLLISYIGQVELSDIEIRAYLINSDRYYKIKEIIQELGSDIFLALPLFYAFTGCDIVPSCYGKGKVYENKTLWSLFMDGVQLPQGWNHFEEAIYFLPLSSQKFLVLILSNLGRMKG